MLTDPYTYLETNDDARRPEVFRAMDSDHFITQGTGADSTWEFVLWSIPEGRRLADIRYPEPNNTLAVAMDVDRGRIVLAVLKDERALIDALGFDGSIVHLGILEFHFATPFRLVSESRLGSRKRPLAFSSRRERGLRVWDWR